MIKNIKTYQYKATKKWYATCISTNFGQCTQWGNSPIEANQNLKKWVETHWGEKWPNKEKKNGKDKVENGF